MANTCYRIDIHDYVPHCINYDCVCMCYRCVCSCAREYVFSTNLTNFMTLRQYLCMLFFERVKDAGPTDNNKTTAIAELKAATTNRFGHKLCMYIHYKHILIQLEISMPLPPALPRAAKLLPLPLLHIVIQLCTWCSVDGISRHHRCYLQVELPSCACPLFPFAYKYPFYGSYFYAAQHFKYLIHQFRIYCASESTFANSPNNTFTLLSTWLSYYYYSRCICFRAEPIVTPAYMTFQHVTFLLTIAIRFLVFTSLILFCCARFFSSIRAIRT